MNSARQHDEQFIVNEWGANNQILVSISNLRFEKAVRPSHNFSLRICHANNTELLPELYQNTAPNTTKTNRDIGEHS